MNIKELRNKMGLSQSKFANYFSIPVTSIQHWEQGVSKPPEYVPKMMVRILELEERLSKCRND